TSDVIAGPAPGARNQDTKAAMPAWATRPTHERSSAVIARYQGRRSSIRAIAAVASAPVERSTRRTVASNAAVAGAAAMPEAYGGGWRERTTRGESRASHRTLCKEILAKKSLRT